MLMVETENWDVSFLTTAWFLETINHWFDLMSSRHPILALSKFNEAKYCEAVDFLRFIVDMFKHIRIGKDAKWKPVQSGIILSTTSMLQVQDKLLAHGHFKFLLTSRFSQDCLENFFSCIRRKNPTPTPLEFKNNLRVLTVAQYLKGADTGSYEQDDGAFVADFLDNTRHVDDDDDDDDGEITVFETCEPLTENASAAVVFDRTELNCLHYLAGYAGPD